MFYTHVLSLVKTISALATYVLCLQEVPDLLLLSALEKLNWSNKPSVRINLWNRSFTPYTDPETISSSSLLPWQWQFPSLPHIAYFFVSRFCPIAATLLQIAVFNLLFHAAILHSTFHSFLFIGLLLDCHAC